jgi:hypothetical protein
MTLARTYQNPHNRVVFPPDTFHTPEQCPVLYLEHNPMHVKVQAVQPLRQREGRKDEKMGDPPWGGVQTNGCASNSDTNVHHGFGICSAFPSRVFPGAQEHAWWAWGTCMHGLRARALWGNADLLHFQQSIWQRAREYLSTQCLENLPREQGNLYRNPEVNVFEQYSNRDGTTRGTGINLLL